MKIEFPKNFLWGASTSAHQVEGGNLNDWNEWEKKNADRLTKEAGEKWEKWQQEKFPEMFKPENYISGQACDHYNRFEEDFDIAQELGHNAHRFSIEWSRIEPEEGKFSEKEIEHYRQVIFALKKRGIEPFVTLWHWTLPLWLAEKGGVRNKNFPKFFERYVGKIACSLEGINFWITQNEPTIYISHAYLRGIWPPQFKSILKSLGVVNNLVKAHKLAYVVLHSTNPRCQVGIAKNDVYYKSSFLAHHFDDSYFTNKVRNYQDFIGLNFYFHVHLLRKDSSPVSDLGWGIDPKLFYHILKRLKKYKKPVYITENGLADAKDERRESFIKEHLFWTHRAMQEGIDVRGYLHWSLLDNFEWDKGFWPRFGLVEIDYKTMKRKIRPSALEYARACKSGELVL